MIGLALRRLFAFGTDVTLILSVLWSVPLVLLSKVLEIEPDWNLAGTAILVLYFGFSEGLFSGQSIGKFLFRIRVRNRIVGELSLYDTFLRATMVFLIPGVVALLFNMLVTLGLSKLHLWSGFLLGYSSLGWLPISVLLGGGRVGLHDIAARTEVVLADLQEPSPPVDTQRQVLVSVLAYVLVGALVTFPIKAFFGRTEEVGVAQLERFSTGKAFSRVLSESDELVRSVENGGHYWNGSVSAKEHLWTPDDAVTFRDSPWASSFPTELREGNTQFRNVITFEIQTRPLGFASRDFKAAIAREIANRLEPNLGTMILYKYQLTELMPFGQVIFSNHLVGVWFRTKDNRLHFDLLEPDSGSMVELQFGLNY